MSSLTFVVEGDPVGKGRPRIVRRSYGHAAITPEKTVRYEARVRDAARVALGTRAPLKGRAAVVVHALWTLPPSRWKKRVPIEAAHRISKPDLDNVVKAVCDALNGLAWLDDSQVVDVAATKWTTRQGDPGRTQIEVVSLDGEWP